MVQVKDSYVFRPIYLVVLVWVILSFEIKIFCTILNFDIQIAIDEFFCQNACMFQKKCLPL